MFSIEEFIIAVYCCVDEELKVLTQGHSTRSRGFEPKLSDAEVLTMEIVAEFQGIDEDKAMWQYFRRHWQGWFPQLSSRSSFVRHSANLWQYKQRLQRQLAITLGAFEDDIHLVDGLPMWLCCLTYAPRCQTFRGVADCGVRPSGFPAHGTNPSNGYCAAKDEHFYGFRGHLNLSFNGVITGFTVTPATGSEREALWEITPSTSGLVIADQGYLSQPLQTELSARGIFLQTPMRSNMKDSRPKAVVRLGQRVRRLIETVNSQLACRFHFERVRARDLWHLTSRVYRKILAHTVCCWLNQQLGRDLLHFDGLISD